MSPDATAAPASVVASPGTAAVDEASVANEEFPAVVEEPSVAVVPSGIGSPGSDVAGVSPSVGSVDEFFNFNDPSADDAAAASWAPVASSGVWRVTLPSFPVDDVKWRARVEVIRRNLRSDVPLVFE